MINIELNKKKLKVNKIDKKIFVFVSYKVDNICHGIREKESERKSALKSIII